MHWQSQWHTVSVFIDSATQPTSSQSWKLCPRIESTARSIVFAQLNTGMMIETTGMRTFFPAAFTVLRGQVPAAGVVSFGIENSY
ncbi:MAG: hypothetical protein WCO86_02330, partial [Planctomycetota bacterium]